MKKYANREAKRQAILRLTLGKMLKHKFLLVRRRASSIYRKLMK